MAVLEQWGVPLAVFGMLLATLFMAAVLKRYQAHQASVRAFVQRLQRGLQQIEESLAALRGVPLSRELRVTLRSEVLARYQKIRGLYRRYPAIQQRIVTAEAALNAEGSPAGGGVGPIENEQAFRDLVRAFDQLLDVFAHGTTLQPVPRDVRAIFQRELGERRAEVMARFHLVQSKRLETSGDIGRSRAHLTTLIHTLRSRGPSTDFVRELYGEAEAALAALTNRQIGMPGSEGDAAGGAA